MTSVHEESRVAEVDSLRGIAALAVMLFHFIYRYPTPTKPKNELIAKIFGYFPIQDFYLGELAVYLFFIISGFVISISALKCKTVAEFGYRRFSRLYPVYWSAVIVLSLIVLLLDGENNLSLLQVVANLTMLQEYFRLPHVSSVFWSLIIELHFYILVAFVIGLGLMKYRGILLVIWSVTVFLYGFYSIPNPVPWPIVRVLLLDYGHFFVYGIAIYQLWDSNQSGADKSNQLTLFLILISIASCLIRYPVTVNVILLSLYLLFYVAVMHSLPVFRNRVLVYFGGISYALYLVHQIIGPIVMRHIAMPRVVEIAVASAVAIIVATALTWWVERPALKWLRINRPDWAR